MTNTTTLADRLEAAVRDGRELMKWTRPNAIAVEDDRVDEAVRRALRGPVPDDYAVGVPLLRYADPSRVAAPLVDAVVDSDHDRPHTCDLCHASALLTTDRLCVPAGASVVAIHCCFHCRGVLQDVFACGLVWG